MDSFLQLAIEAAKAAGRLQLNYFHQPIEIRTKEGKHHNRVTVADLESEDLIVSSIKEKYPDHNILAEEGTYPKTDSAYTWVIDPLDGTNNFSRGIPIYAVSIALVKDNQVIVGVVYDVSRDELFAAEKGRGASLNGQSLKVSGNSQWSDCLLTTGFYYDRGQAMIENLEKIKKFFLCGILGIRRFGAASLDLCNVACGRMDGYWEFELSPWDFAAGICIVEEAGGKVTDKEGKALTMKSSYVVASNNLIHQGMLEMLQTP